MGVASPDATVRSLINQGVAESTLASYVSGKRWYLSFCTQFHYLLMRPLFCTLLHFCSHPPLAIRQLHRLYLCAACHLQILNNLPDPALASFCRLNYALRGIRREGPPKQPHTRLPITLEMLHKIFQVWSQGPQDAMGCFLCGFFLVSCAQVNSLVCH